LSWKPNQLSLSEVAKTELEITFEAKIRGLKRGHLWHFCTVFGEGYSLMPRVVPARRWKNQLPTLAANSGGVAF
jgi:hypothetical protein